MVLCTHTLVNAHDQQGANNNNKYNENNNK